MKKLLCFMLALMLVLAACGSDEPAGEPPVPDEIIEPDDIPEPEPEEITEPEDPDYIVYLRENFMSFTIDGSTSMIPLHQSLRNRFGNGEEIWHNRTVWAFEQFMNGETDILFSVDFNDELLEKAAERSVDIVQLPVTREAFVFLINEHNPVQNLTTEQIKGIYSGEIANWSELSKYGDDAPITAFQRNADSGSQIRMEKFMGDTPLMDKDVTYQHGMGEIIMAITSFDEGKYSIAYNMYTFAEKQFESEDMILLAVDGVSPTDETIFDGSYPLVIYNYIYYDANNAQAAEFANNLHAFLMSEDGQKLISDSGYVNLNISLDRNMRINPFREWSWEISGQDWLWFYNEAKGEFYEPDGEGGLLVFDNYADFVLNGTVHVNNTSAREFLGLVYNSELRTSRFTEVTARIPWWGDNTDVIFIDPFASFIWEPIGSFDYRFDGKYYSSLWYYIEEGKLVLKAADKEGFEQWAEQFIDFVEYMASAADSDIELTFEDLKNLYLRTDNRQLERRDDGHFVLEYFKPFN